MNVIYKPKGRALEYAPFACNLYMGCTHGCVYCYAPGCVRRTSDAWHNDAEARNNIVEAFNKDAEWLSKNLPDNDNRRVLFCFLSDPYQPLESKLHITRKCIEIAKEYGIKVDVLTKGSYARVSKDFQLMREAGVHLGVTLSFVTDKKRQEWEPNASSVADRLKILKTAHELGIFTWVSMEPVIDSEEALLVIDKAHEFVDYWKVGKLNHNKEVEDSVDWHKFYLDVKNKLKSYNANFYIKKDLRAFARKDSSVQGLRRVERKR